MQAIEMKKDTREFLDVNLFIAFADMKIISLIIYSYYASVAHVSQAQALNLNRFICFQRNCINYDAILC